MQQNNSKEKACISTKVRSESEPIKTTTANFRHKVAFFLKALQGPHESSGA
jgi:hypothetical protein